MRQLSPTTKRLYAREIKLYERLKTENRVMEYLQPLKLSTRTLKIIIWNKFCDAKLDLPYERITFDPKCIPSKQLERFHQFVSGYCDDDGKLFIDLGLRLGLRLSEIIGINRDSIRDNGIAVLRKGGKFQIVPCSEEILERVRISGGVQFKARHYQRMLQKIGTLLGIKISPHGLRHTFATELAAQNCNIFTLQKLMGHSDINTTSKYVHVTFEQMRSIIK